VGLEGEERNGCSESTRMEGTESTNEMPEMRQLLALQRLDPHGGY